MKATANYKLTVTNMSLKVSMTPKREYTITPAGNHLARVYSIIDIGTVPEEFQGEIKYMPKVRIGFELPNEMHEFEYTDKETGKEVKVSKPFAISQEYTMSLGNKAKLRPVVEGIIGATLKDEEAAIFDLNDIMGSTCMLDVRHKVSKSGNNYAIIGAVSSVPKGMAIPDAVNEPVHFDWDNFSEEVFNSLPDFIKDKMTTSDEWKRKEAGENTDIPATDIPF